jgi:alpha-L-rhamnosidase
VQINNLKTNHLVNPLGYELVKPFVSWIVENTRAKKQIAAQVVVKKGLNAEIGILIFDSGKNESLSSLGYELPIELEPYTRYFWKVFVWADNDDFAESDWAFFETAKLKDPWKGQWICANLDKEIHPYIRKTFSISAAEAQWARAYVCGLGLYELEINGRKVSEEFLMPGYHSYDSFVQYQTYDILEYLQKGTNTIGAMLGPGWYKGRFVFRPGFTDIYGDTMQFICELHIRLTDGTELFVASGNDWESHSSPVKASSIYDGEEYSALETVPNWSIPDSFGNNTAKDNTSKEWASTKLTNRATFDLRERINPPILIHEKLTPEKIICNDIGEIILDFGQEITGWVSFTVKGKNPADVVKLSYSEIMQDGKFYRDNLRTAKAEYTYISDGTDAIVRPHFTFFGFRYVKVEGLSRDELTGFIACAIYSDIERTGWIETDNPEIDRLINNIIWSQKGNFLDIPTDCPQRDERMGWSGDAAVFCETAHQNMYTPAFFNHFLQNIQAEQEKNNGAIPLFAPTPKPKNIDEENPFSFILNSAGASVWGDVGSILPWSLYTMYGSKNLLRRHYPIIKAWAEYIIHQDNENGGSGLWKTGNHLGDWLSLDKEDERSPKGATDVYFIASAFYYNTVCIAKKSSAVLGFSDEYEQYREQAKKIKEAFISTYFTVDGKLTIAETQTALIVALYFELFPLGKAQQLCDALVKRLESKDMHLDTGFVGTPYLCLVLSKYGANKAAYSLLLQNTYPGWLYEVRMGATTIWERWNSILPNGKLSDTMMNSLNHYAYGSIANWMYRYMCGLNPVEEEPGFKKAIIMPMPDLRLKKVHMIRFTASGRYEITWEVQENGVIAYTVTVPFDCKALVKLPGKETVTVLAGDHYWRI